MIGQVFWWGAVADLTPPEEAAEVAGALQALVRKGLIRPDRGTFAGEDGFRFGHILMRDAAYDSMPKRLRADLHERCADWVEARPDAPPELDEILGHHLEQAYAYRMELVAGGRSPSRCWPHERRSGWPAPDAERSPATTRTLRQTSSAAQRLCDRETPRCSSTTPRRYFKIGEFARAED